VCGEAPDVVDQELERQHVFVPVRALAWKLEARYPAARVRLYAVAARVSQAVFAVNFLEGRWPSVTSSRLAKSCSI
jgi:hypothetical protein